MHGLTGTNDQNMVVLSTFIVVNGLQVHDKLDVTILVRHSVVSVHFARCPREGQHFAVVVSRRRYSHLLLAVDSSSQKN